MQNQQPLFGELSAFSFCTCWCFFPSFTCITSSRISCRIMRCNFSICSIFLCLKHTLSISISLFLPHLLYKIVSHLLTFYLVCCFLCLFYICLLFLVLFILFFNSLLFFNIIFNCLRTTQEKRTAKSFIVFHFVCC